MDFNVNAINFYKYPEQNLDKNLCNNIYDKLNHPNFPYSSEEPIIVNADLLIEDVLTTGKSSYESIKCIKSFGAEVICLAPIIDRSEESLKLECPYISLAKINAPIFSKDDVPLNLRGIPAVKPGSRFIK